MRRLLLGASSVALGALLAVVPSSLASATPTPEPTPQECAGAGARAVERGCPIEDSGLVLPLPPLADRDRAGIGENEGGWTDEAFVSFASCTFGSPTAAHSVVLVDYRLQTFLIPKCFATTEPGGTLVYRDGSHLSTTWIRAFADAFTNATSPAMAETGVHDRPVGR